MERSIDHAISTQDHTVLSTLFSLPPTDPSTPTLTEGERRTMAAYYIRSAVDSDTYLPDAFHLPDVIPLMNQLLEHVPPSIERAVDNTLRLKLFDHLVDTHHYHDAAVLLATHRMEDTDEASVYYLQPHERCDIYVKIAECHLHDNDSGAAEGFVQKAGDVLEWIERPEEHVRLILRFKKMYARVLEITRKFLQAAGRYYDLSLQGEGSDEEKRKLVRLLGKAGICAMLAPSGELRERILRQVHTDERLPQLAQFPEFQSHIQMLTHMCAKHIIRRDDDLTKFEESLSDHHKTILDDGLSIFQRAVIEHNLVAIECLYSSIYFTELGTLLGVSASRAEGIVAKMIVDGSIHGWIDQVDGLLSFEENRPAMNQWDETITGFCSHLNEVVDAIRKET